jgi:D-3-phosphoglycerate dehydrogenase / 2-oxoglutarate reductase
MAKPVVLLFEGMHEKAIALLKQHAEVRMAESLDEEKLLAVVGDVDGIIIRANGKVSRRLMQAAPRLKVVARHGVGVEAIDREAAAELGITVVNTPDANNESVAEQCVGMMIALAKRLVEADLAIRAGDWGSRYRLTGVEVFGKTLGVVGFGRIGRRVAEMCHLGLGMQVVYYDVVAYPEEEARLGAKRLALDELLGTADFVSVHLPLVPATLKIINAEKLACIRPGAYLINTSRGPVIDQAALVQALQEGKIRGAGLDVYDPEPLPADSPILKLPNVVLSPHMAAHTDEALYRMAMVAEDVLAVIAGRAPSNPVPPPKSS